MNRHYGIDLGTTHTVLAVFEAGRARVVGGLLPSVVAVDRSGGVVVGEAAVQRLEEDDAAGVRRFKADMGTDRAFVLGTEPVDAVALSARVLAELRARAAQGGHRVDHAVITVPAWFRETQRAATVDAAKRAGIEVTRIINEPTAAALAWGLQNPGAACVAAVLDLGGGTFDVTCLEIYEGVVDVRGSTGDVRLGGEDFTDALVDHVVLTAGPGPMSGRARGNLRAACEAAKRALSSAPRASIRFAADDGVERVVTVDGHTLERLAFLHLARVRRCVAEGLAQARFNPGDVQEVLLVGGATRMEAVRALSREIFGREPRTDVQPDHAIALGAAVQAALVARDEAVRDFLLTDILTHTLGVDVVAFHGEHAFPDRLRPVVSRGTTLPVSTTHPFLALRPEQRELRFNIYQGEHRIASHNERLGELVIKDLPPTTTGEPHGVVVRFTCDPSGLIEVEGTVQQTGQRVTTVIERSVLEGREREAALGRMSALRTPAADLLPNRVLLDRAGLVVASLSGRAREEIDQQVLAFEAVLRSGEPRRIERAREALNVALDAVEARHGLGR